MMEVIVTVIISIEVGLVITMHLQIVLLLCSDTTRPDVFLSWRIS